MALTKIIESMLHMGTPAEGDVLSFIGNKWIPKKVSGVPAGAMMSFAGGTAPEGWLLCHGQAVDRTTYAGLFASLGTTYGAGDGSTTFNLPDLRGRTPIGLDNMGGTSANRITASQADSLGGVGGAQNQTPSGSVSISGSVGSTTLSTSQMPSHTHTIVANNYSGSSQEIATAYDRATFGTKTTSSEGSSGSHNHSFSGSGSFSGNSLDVTQPWLAVNVIIKT